MADPSSDWRTELAQLAEKLRDPFKMRMTVACAAAAIFVLGISDPMEKRIRESKTVTKRWEGKIKTAREIELLQTSLASVEPKMMKGEGTDDVLKHLIQIFRSHPMNLMRMEPEPPQAIGPFKSVRVTAEMEGEYVNLQSLLLRLESDPHLIRIETLSIEANKQGSGPARMQLVIRMLQESI